MRRYDPDKFYWLHVRYRVPGNKVEAYIKMLQEKGNHDSYHVEEIKRILTDAEYDKIKKTRT